jgi:hypothetical protein
MGPGRCFTEISGPLSFDEVLERYDSWAIKYTGGTYFELFCLSLHLCDLVPGISEAERSCLVTLGSSLWLRGHGYWSDAMKLTAQGPFDLV